VVLTSAFVFRFGSGFEVRTSNFEVREIQGSGFRVRILVSGTIPGRRIQTRCATFTAIDEVAQRRTKLNFKLRTSNCEL